MIFQSVGIYWPELGECKCGDFYIELLAFEEQGDFVIRVMKVTNSQKVKWILLTSNLFYLLLFRSLFLFILFFIFSVFFILFAFLWCLFVITLFLISNFKLFAGEFLIILNRFKCIVCLAGKRWALEGDSASIQWVDIRNET